MGHDAMDKLADALVDKLFSRVTSLGGTSGWLPATVERHDHKCPGCKGQLEGVWCWLQSIGKPGPDCNRRSQSKGCLCKGQGFSCVWMVFSRRQSQGEVGERARWSERKRKLLGRCLCTNELFRSTWLLHYCGFGQASLLP